MAVSYSDPFRMFLVKDGAKRTQLTDPAKALALAKKVVVRTGASLDDVLVVSKFWYARKYTPTAPRRKATKIRVCTKKTTKTAAKRWVDAKRAQAAAGVVDPTARLLSEAAEEWVLFKELEGRIVRAYRGQAAIWKRYFDGVLVSEVEGADIVRYFKQRADGKLTDAKKKPAAATLVKDRVLLHGFFGWCREQAYCISNPADSAPKFTLEHDDPEALTRDEVTKLLAACRDPYKLKVGRKKWRTYDTVVDTLPPPYLHGIVQAALHTLLRMNSLVTLRWSDIDLERKRITIPAERMKMRRKHIVPLTATMADYFAKLKEAATGSRVWPVGLPSVRKAFRKAAERAGLPKVSFHTLRKTGATILLDAGVPLQTVQRLGAWKTPDVLLKHYAATSDAELGKATDVLDDIGNRLQ